MSLITPAFSVNTKTLRDMHPSLTPDQIWKLLEATLQTEAVQSMVLDTFEILANREPPPTPAAPPKYPHLNTARLATLLSSVRGIDSHAVICGAHVTIPTALWTSFIALARADQPPHYSSSRK